jgi:glycosyltransferase involved in cell wall biosynthesis
MNLPVSACVLACNEAEDLERCLRSLAWADEIVVVIDSKSADASETVARRLASRVEVRPYAGDIEQKGYCTGLAKNDWAFVIDADEVATPELAESIREMLAQVGGADRETGSVSSASAGFRVNRATYHLGRWIRHGDFYPDWKLRLYRRSRARWVGRDPHGRVVVDGVVRDLSGDLEHYSYRDLADQIDRIQFFSDQAAAALVEDGIPFRLGHLLFRPPARFLRSYLLRQGFRDGLPGFVIAVAIGFYVFLKYAKHWERMRR